MRNAVAETTPVTFKTARTTRITTPDQSDWWSVRHPGQNTEYRRIVEMQALGRTVVSGVEVEDIDGWYEYPDEDVSLDLEAGLAVNALNYLKRFGDEYWAAKGATRNRVAEMSRRGEARFYNCAHFAIAMATGIDVRAYTYKLPFFILERAYAEAERTDQLRSYEEAEAGEVVVLAKRATAYTGWMDRFEHAAVSLGPEHKGLCLEVTGCNGAIALGRADDKDVLQAAFARNQNWDSYCAKHPRDVDIRVIPAKIVQANIVGGWRPLDEAA